MVSFRSTVIPNAIKKTTSTTPVSLQQYHYNNTMSSSARFLIYYWPLPFRGNFLKSLFAYTGTPYEVEQDFKAIVALKGADIAAQPSPFMAPPAVHDRTADVFMAQMPAAAFYVASQVGLLPSDVTLQATCLKVVCDCNDVLDGVTRNGGSQMWDAEAWQTFSTARLPRWLQILEGTAVKHGLAADKGYFLGTEQATLADMAAFALLEPMARTFEGTSLTKLLRDNAPNVMALVDRLQTENEGLKDLVAQQTKEYGTTYCGGQIEKSIRKMLE